MNVREVEFAVHPAIFFATAGAHEELRLRDRRVGDAVVRHFVDATDDDNGLSGQVRNDVLEEFSRVPDLC